MTETVRSPRQVRSRETMDRILEAAVAILEKKTFDELTITEVVSLADTSVGAFYGRFKDKDALLQALDIRFFIEFERGIESMMEPSRWEGKTIPFIIRDVTRLLVETYDANQGVLRSLNLKARLSGDSRYRKRENHAWNELFPRLQEALLSRKGEMAHSNPLLATRLGFQQLFFGMRDILLWEPLRGGDPYDREELIDELSKAYVSYLGVGR